jgi:hypothetical protein
MVSARVPERAFRDLARDLSLLARQIAISYTTNHSILWAIIHGILSWLYVIYFALFQA